MVIRNYLSTVYFAEKLYDQNSNFTHSAICMPTSGAGLVHNAITKCHCTASCMNTCRLEWYDNACFSLASKHSRVQAVQVTLQWMK